MCFGGDDNDVPPPAPPPMILDQEAPAKKTENKKDANSLAIGTKRYRNETGLGSTASKKKVTPTGPAVTD